MLNPFWSFSKIHSGWQTPHRYAHGEHCASTRPAPSKAPACRIHGTRFILTCVRHKLAIIRANQVHALDFTYISLARGFVNFTVVVDVASRRVLLHKVAVTLEACHTKEVIEQAWGQNPSQPQIRFLRAQNVFEVIDYTLGFSKVSDGFHTHRLKLVVGHGHHYGVVAAWTGICDR